MFHLKDCVVTEIIFEPLSTSYYEDTESEYQILSLKITIKTDIGIEYVTDRYDYVNVLKIVDLVNSPERVNMTWDEFLQSFKEALQHVSI